MRERTAAVDAGVTKLTRPISSSEPQGLRETFSPSISSIASNCRESTDVVPDPFPDSQFFMSITPWCLLFLWHVLFNVADFSKNAPQGKHHVVFDNAVPGRASHALQGFGIDGRQIGRLHVSGWIKTDQVRSGPEKDMLPLLVVTFYDENRRDLGQRWLGPWRNSRDWERVEKSIRVPPAAREGIVRVGLFGAVGRFSIDAITMQARSRRPISRFSPAAFFLTALLLFVVFGLLSIKSVIVDPLLLAGSVGVIAGFAARAGRASERFRLERRWTSLIAAVIHYGSVFLASLVTTLNVSMWWLNWTMKH